MRTDRLRRPEKMIQPCKIQQHTNKNEQKSQNMINVVFKLLISIMQQEPEVWHCNRWSVLFLDSGNLDLNILCSSIFLSKISDGMFFLHLAANGGTYLPFFYVSTLIFFFIHLEPWHISNSTCTAGGIGQGHQHKAEAWSSVCEGHLCFVWHHTPDFRRMSWKRQVRPFSHATGRCRQD